MSVQPTAKMKQRLNIGVVLALIAFIVYIMVFLVNTSLIRNEEFQEMANRSQFGSTTIHANRGSIYDRNRVVLARSSTVWNIVLDPTNFKSVDIDKVPDSIKGKTNYTIANLLADKMYEMFDVPPEEVLEKAEKNNRYQVIKKKVSKAEADAVVAFCKENDITSVYPEQDTKRYYPLNDSAAAVIGFLDGDGSGQYGLEAYYDDYLAGVNGRIISAKDAWGNEMPYRYEKTFDAQDGNSLVLTIDSTLQHYLEKHLEEAVTTYKAEKRACGIIMNAKTGEIYAMATVPGFDLNSPTTIYDPVVAEYLATLEGEEYKNAYATAREMQWKNKAITESYYPGSVFKVITGSAALEERVIDRNSQFSCHPMQYPGMPKPFNCWTRSSHGVQNFDQAMTNSCNPAFIQIGEKLGAKLFSQYYAAYGLTEQTGIDLPGEASSANLYVKPDRMGVVELGSSSFGQTNKVTPIQMITAYAAAINGGNLVTPYVVSKIEDANGNVVKENKPQIKRQVISAETSKDMREVLENVVSTNGGSNAYIKGYAIGGKSGTSQKQDENNAQNRDDLYVSSYVGFAPADDPEIICLVMVDQPSTGEYYGSIIAVPVVRQVFEEALPYLGYYKEYTAEELENLEIAVPSLEGQNVAKAKATLEDLRLSYEVIGENTDDSAIVVKQIPSRGVQLLPGGKVILYTDEDYEQDFVIVPNVIGMKPKEANRLLTEAGVNIKVTGPSQNPNAEVMLQNWPEGSILPKGTIVEVLFAVNDRTG